MRRLRFEELEARRLFATDVLNALESYVGFVGDFSSLENKNVIRISREDLSYETFNAALQDAAASSRDDVIAVENGGTLTFQPGSEAFKLNDLQGSITIIGLNGDFVIDAARFDGVFLIGSGSVVNFGAVVMRGGTTDYGGAIRNAGTLTIEKSAIYDCLAVSGGAVYNTGEFYFQDSTIGACVASRSGGAIYVGGSESAVCVGSNSVIVGNASDGAGTVYVAEKCVFRSYHCTVVRNEAATATFYAERGATSATNGKIVVANTISVWNVDLQNEKLPALNVGSGRANLTDMERVWANNFVYSPSLPLFVAVDDYRLAFDSQALDVAISSYSVDVYGRELRRDSSGGSRSSGSGVDVGAFERQIGAETESTINVVVKRVKETTFLLDFSLSAAASRWRVDWGDGTVSNADELTTAFRVGHYYAAPGDYVVTLTLDDCAALEVASLCVPASFALPADEISEPTAPIGADEIAVAPVWTSERRKAFATVWEEFESFEFDL